MVASERTKTVIGEMPISDEKKSITGGYVKHEGETYYRIAHYDQMPPFFMSLVSSADHWLFVASTGGLTAGRSNADSALFPYETEDKITAHSEETGSKTIIRVKRNGQSQLWEPFSNRYAGIYRCERHLYKNISGDKLIFEEINHDLQLTLRTAWRSSERFGFVKSSWLQNDGDACAIDLLDGLLNILPYGANTALQTTMSSLLHAYKRNELDRDSGAGIFALSATLTDRAEPSESLRATVAWQVGLDAECTLLCADQLDDFRHGRSLTPEYDIRGKAGAYLVITSLALPAQQQKQWHVIADVNQDNADLTRLIRFLQQDQRTIVDQIEADITQGSRDLIHYVAAADGLQLSAQETTTAHHFANVLFNIMRGGIFADGYQVERDDLLAFVRVRNRKVLQDQGNWFASLPAQMSIKSLYSRAAETKVPDLIRLCFEYLPLFFSRRHGDPSRPWNRFSINLKKGDGSRNLDYQGNWRDIFQNWEPLALSFPAYIEGFIAKFLNATTADGYNPYRITRDGIEWEVPEPENPWSNIGYWSDHQIIYLQKLLEIAERVHPGSLAQLWMQPVFAYADVPYRLRSYEEMLADWYNTIDFDWESEAATEQAVTEMGSDGRLVRDVSGHVRHVTMAEKLLVLLLAKLVNLVPEGGIWMNTQRPEWNDANNALVGKGLSVVTVAYLRRFIVFWRSLLAGFAEESFLVNTAVADLFRNVQRILTAYQPHLETTFEAQARRAFMDELGAVATNYRTTIYEHGLPTTAAEISGEAISNLLGMAQAYIDHTLHANRRADNLYHSYNILHLDEKGASVEHLYLMLEGQVAILSAGLLTADEALELLHSLRASDLYRADQHSYMLYPNRELPGFRQKNNVREAQVAGSALVERLMAAGDTRLLMRDVAGVYHFNGGFRNVNDVGRVLDELEQEPAYAELVTADRALILNLFEDIFDHRAFTGRSGTFFAYEGLGSIYWHMVSKLLLATEECYQQALAAGADQDAIDGLAAAYYDIRQGLGFNKSPAVYGAFPTDPYSHTPMGGGARQPGMTGQVKEEILTRWGELGVAIEDGRLRFWPTLLKADEFLPQASEFRAVDVTGETKSVSLPAGSLAFTYCQVPVIYSRGREEKIMVTFVDGRSVVINGRQLDAIISKHVFARDGQVALVQVVSAAGGDT